MKNKDPRANEIYVSEIIETVKQASLSCYGIAGFVNNRKGLNNEPSKKGNKEEAVIIKKGIKGLFSVDVYLLLASGIKITEALSSAQQTIKYELDKKFPGECSKVNVFAEQLSSK